MRRQMLMENIWDRCIKRTRSGRICRVPVAKWSGEKLFTTLQGEMPARYITLRGRMSSLLVSCSKSERRKRMMLNSSSSTSSIKISKKKDCKSRSIKGKTYSPQQHVTTRSRKDKTLHEDSPIPRNRATPSHSRCKIPKVPSTVDHMKPGLNYHIADDLDTSSEIDDKLVRRCLRFDASPQTSKVVSARELRMQARQLIAEKESGNRKHITKNTKKVHEENTVVSKKKDLNKIRSTTATELNNKQKIKNKINDAKSVRERTKIKSARNRELTSEDKDGNINIRTIDLADYRKRLRSGSTHSYGVQTRNSKSKSVHEKRNFKSDKAAVLQKKKIVQESNRLSYTDLRSRKDVQEPCSAEPKHIRSPGDIEKTASSEVSKEKERYGLRKKILQEKNCQGCLDSCGRQKNQELSNQKLKHKNEISDIENDSDTSYTESKADEADNVGYGCRSWKGGMLNTPVCSAKKIQKCDTPKLNTKSSLKQCVSKMPDIGTILNIGGDKKPGEGTLKMKKLLAAKLEEFNKEHTDDLFEGKEVFNLQEVLNLENVLDEDCELDLSFNTPKLMFHVISPPLVQIAAEVDSLANPSEFNCDRSDADAYLYRRQMMKKAKKISEVCRRSTPQSENLSIRMADATKRLDKLLRKVPFTDETETCSDEEVMSDYMEEFCSSDLDE